MSADQPMTAIVEYQIRNENTTMDEWLAEWDKRAEDARVGEPETTAYASAINLENALNVLVFERYAKGNSSLRLHTDRPAHHTLIEVMGERRMTKRRVMSSRFSDVADFGWWGRPECHDGNGEGIVLVILGLRFADAGMGEAFIKLSSEHAAYCWKNEPDTLIYSGGLARSDADRELDIKEGDLIFVMGCTDMAAVEKHRDDPNHLALGAKMVEKQLQMENTFRRMYKTTGHGFLWRE
ncbi:MAG: hypothetical protein E2O61_04805 [Gammaproteobacteria bacterium]|nr:MAG: hypothetical protein E2O61_04805 [Gammaproteobacteria bacterium]